MASITLEFCIFCGRQRECTGDSKNRRCLTMVILFSYQHIFSLSCLPYLSLEDILRHNGSGTLHRVYHTLGKVRCSCALHKCGSLISVSGIIMGFPTTVSMNLVCVCYAVASRFSSPYARVWSLVGPSCRLSPSTLVGLQAQWVTCQMEPGDGYYGRRSESCVQIVLFPCFPWLWSR